MQLEIFMTKSKGKSENFFKNLPVEKIPFAIHSAVTQTFFQYYTVRVTLNRLTFN
jgi:hypothetical protein